MLWLLILTLIPVAILGYDLYLWLKTAFIRRFLQGRVRDERVWQASVLKRCEKWLIRTPKVPSSDINRLVLMDRIKGTYYRHSIQTWQEASLYLAVRESTHSAKERINEKRLQAFEKRVCEDPVFSDDIGAADYGLLAFSLLPVNPALGERMFRYCSMNASQEGFVLYRKGYLDLAFVDALGFVCPFLVRYGILRKNPEAVTMAKKQISLYMQYGIEKTSGLPFHAIDIYHKTPLGICDWGRGLAWLLIAFMDSHLTLEAAEADDDFFLRHIQTYANSLLLLQRNNGSFGWRLLNKGVESDSSATAVLGWFLAESARILKDSKYLLGAEKCRAFLMRVTSYHGVIDFCQGDTIGVGVYSRRFGSLPFAQGFALRLQMAIEKAHRSLQ